MDDLLAEFLTESNESLSALGIDLVRLEQNPDDPTLLGNIFRLMHTIKGTCGFLGLSRLESVAHAAENVLGRVRDGELVVTPEVVTLILEAVDRIRELLAVLEATEAEPEGDDAPLIARLDRVAEGAEASALPREAKAAATEAPVPAMPAPAMPEPVTEIPAATAKSGPAGNAANGVGEGEKESAVSAQSIRVNVALLENLMTMVSELVLTRNQLMQILRSQKDSEFAAPLQRLSHVTTELQENVMKTRMQPIGNAWAKLPRLVRDLGLELGKKLDLRMLGAETELDRQVLELIRDPLTHMVRNSADHGIESPAERVAAGKPETGTITLNAFHEGGHIVIEIADDGRGLAVDKIRRKAIANGLAGEAELAGMSDQQICQFIFKAGFSTAAEVTSVSGRGVGMDVVRTNIEKIGGTIELKSGVGRGTAFVIKIPLTLAIISGLIVECAGERFAIPQIGILELVRVSAKSENRIEWLNEAPVLRLRERLLPLVSLQQLLGLEAREGAGEESFIIVTQVGAYTFGIIVDRVFDTEEIVVKPVSPILRDITIFSGNTILGDGSVVMILDPNGIAAATGELLSETSQRDRAAQRAEEAEETTTLLLFRAGSRDPKAVPLALVARLEEIDPAKIEHADGKPVVQYRNRLMPLVSIGGEIIANDRGRQPVLVFADGERSMGLLVDEIIDIVEARVEVQLAGERPGLLGSTIIAGKSTDLVDVSHYLTEAADDWFSAPAKPSGEALRRILLVDDSAFFRNLLKPLLAVAGYEVTTVETAERALELCEAGETFDIILSDIEMPATDGFAFAERLRRLDRWRGTPLVALSSHASPEDIERGRRAGFDSHVAKSDRAALLEVLSASFSDRRKAA